MMTPSNGNMTVFRKWTAMLRIPNLAIIVLTQYLLGYGIIRPYFLEQGSDMPLGHLNFFVLVLTTLLIAAGGYIINDHFDVNTDRRNKPGKNMLDGLISVRMALRVYYIINGIAILLGFYLAWQTGSYQLGLIFPAITGLLWFYSSRYQRMPFWGNFIVSLLSATVILFPWLFNFMSLLRDGDEFVKIMGQLADINSYIWAFAFFAFLVSMFREVIKDIQDVSGDSAMGYRTIPVIWGVNVSRGIAAALVVITMVCLALAQWYLYASAKILPFWYLLVAVQTILIYLLYLIAIKKDPEDYGFLGQTSKIIMLAGILSIELIYISH
ncbi:MAG: geranylgeranylglycerol-phosphate geranylgeranyltransferase [Bacteroidales bacterium]|jgi:4-hydroxybenzoate polyprenyltransferase|nr:geranylgeranylglycerol-phosphate geranylgeranyltransferase [Bacteroidales bacterium]